MLFASLPNVAETFLSMAFVGFFVLVFLVYWSLPTHRLRMTWLLVASVFFYVSSEAWAILLILFSASIDYLAALAMEKSTSRAWRRFLLVGSITMNLGLLGYFKYANFFLDNVSSAGNWFGFSWNNPVGKLVLPLGISFYTFETISYVADVYMKRAKAVRSLLDYALYIMFFPHLLAGPIVRPRDFLPQLQRPKRFDPERLQLGIRLFMLGFFKKGVLANHLGNVAEPVFQNPEQYGSYGLWLGVLAYTMQIYGDFSGYSDMGIGLAHMLGFKLPMNFNMPYIAHNITEFWRRWHISLSSWLRDYLYIPLGGNRGGQWATYRNLLITMFLGGLWHGASWTFVLWGVFHGLLLAGHRLCAGRKWAAPFGWKVIGIPLTLACVCVGWVLFRAQTLGAATTILAGMFWPTAGMPLPPVHVFAVGACLAVMVVGHCLGCMPKVLRLHTRLPEPVWGAALAAFLILTMMLLLEDGQTFIYFRF